MKGMRLKAGTHDLSGFSWSALQAEVLSLRRLLAERDAVIESLERSLESSDTRVFLRTVTLMPNGSHWVEGTVDGKPAEWQVDS